MKTVHLLLALLLLGAPLAEAQFASFGDTPIEITADGETRFVDGLAVAEDNVVIHYGETSVYADYAQYNPETRDVLVIGNVRLYREGYLFSGDRALYNLETKLLRTAEFQGSSTPFFFAGQSANSMEGNALLVSGAVVTTSDSSKPDYRLKARRIRIYPGNRVVLSNVSLVIGETTVFWFPYVYQSLDRNVGFNFTPGYDGNWGAFLLSQYGFPLTKNLHGILHLDLRSKRGVGLGLDVEGTYGHQNQSWMKLSGYYAHDTSTDTNRTAYRQEAVSADRYRLGFQGRTYFTETVYANVDVNKLSDRRVLRDFFPSEYNRNPQPDNVASITHRSDNYTITAIARGQVNEFFDATERLPEIALDIKRQPIFGNLFFYESETSVAWLGRRFGMIDGTSTTPFSDYRATRLDTFHQFISPQLLGGWLSVVPQIGLRGTYYSHGARSVVDDYLASVNDEQLDLRSDIHNLFQQADGSGFFRPVINVGVESSFKFSRVWENVQSRAWGLDGLRHIVQPYTNFSFVYSGKDPDQILQFDRLNPSTQLPPITFPQFTTIDSISRWSIWRFGVRNRWQTRRDDRTISWLEMDTFFDVNIDQPHIPGSNGNQDQTLSNLFHRLAWEPLPWLRLGIDSQIPLQPSGFTQVNTQASFMVNRDLRLTVGHRYLNNNPYFVDSSSLRLGAYYRINDNWGVSVREQFELSESTLEVQEYALHRDLSSWVASLGVQIRDNRNPVTGRSVTDFGVLLTFTLKDLPSINLPVGFDPSAATGN